MGGIAARNISKEAGYEYMKKLLHEKHVDREDVRSKDYIVDLSKRIDIYSESFFNDLGLIIDDSFYNLILDISIFFMTSFIAIH